MRTFSRWGRTMAASGVIVSMALAAMGFAAATTAPVNRGAAPDHQDARLPVEMSEAFGDSSVQRTSAALTQATQKTYVPHLVSAGYDPVSLVDGRQAPSQGLRGMVGFGESTLELQNRTGGAIDVDVLFTSMFAFDDVFASKRLDPYAVDKILLRHTDGVAFSDYAARVTSSGEIGVVARSMWEGGAMAVYSAPEPSKSLLLPLFAVDVYSHTTILQLTNTEATHSNDVTMELFDPNGALVRDFRFGLEAGESGRIDPYALVDFQGLPVIAGGGYLGAARFTADMPVAIMAYGDEAEGRGATAVTARPRSKAATSQHLPLVRANVGGNSLIAVANDGDETVEVTIRYIGSSNSPSGAGQTIEQHLSIGKRHHAIIDIDPQRRRGTVDPPDLPRGSSLGHGFFGSASVQASGPVLVSVLEQDLRYDDAGLQRVLTSAAYNAFGPDDLGKTFVVPRARVGLDGYTTNIIVMNPGTSTAQVTVEWVGAGPQGAERQSWGPEGIAPGAIAAMVPTLVQSGLPAQAIVRSSSPVAVLVYDVAAEQDLGAYWAVRLPDDVDELPEPPRATATFTPTATSTTSPTPTSRWPNWTPEATLTPETPPTSAATAVPTGLPTEPATDTPTPTDPPSPATATATSTLDDLMHGTLYLPRCYRP